MAIIRNVNGLIGPDNKIKYLFSDKDWKSRDKLRYTRHILGKKYQFILTLDKSELGLTTLNWMSNIFKKDKAVLNLGALNKTEAKYIKPKLLEIKEETDKNKIVVGNFDISFSTLNKDSTL